MNNIINPDSDTSPNEGFCCENCDDVCCVENKNECKICSSDLCYKCLQKDDNKMINEWLYSSNECCKCKRIGCKECINYCYECGNKGDDSTYCYLCEEINEIECKYHKWYYCDKHKNVECGQCVANKNYDEKHSIN